MGRTDSQRLVRGTGERQRGSLRRLLAELGDKEEDEKRQTLHSVGLRGKEVGQEEGMGLERDRVPLQSFGRGSGLSIKRA